MHRIALGRKVAVLPPGTDQVVARRPDHRSDGGPSPVVLLLAWPAHSTSLPVAALARAAAAAIGPNAVASSATT